MKTVEEFEREFDELIDADLAAAMNLAQRLLEKCRNAPTDSNAKAAQKKWDERRGQIKRGEQS